MNYTPEFMKEYLGKNYDPKDNYILDTHNGAVTRDLNPKFKRVGEVPDSAPGEGGTMIVFKRVTPSPAASRFGGKKS